jgi:hypothetical protein
MYVSLHYQGHIQKQPLLLDSTLHVPFQNLKINVIYRHNKFNYLKNKKPFLAYALTLSSCPLRNLIIKISSVSPYSEDSSSLCFEVAGTTRGSLDFKSAVVTWRV